MTLIVPKRMAYQISRVKDLRSIPFVWNLCHQKQIWGLKFEVSTFPTTKWTIHVTVKEHQSHVDPDPRSVGQYLPVTTWVTQSPLYSSAMLVVGICVKLDGWFQIYFDVHPYLGKMTPFWQAYFFKGLVQPPTSKAIYRGHMSLLLQLDPGQTLGPWGCWNSQRKRPGDHSC